MRAMRHGHDGVLYTLCTTENPDDCQLQLREARWHRFYRKHAPTLLLPTLLLLSIGAVCFPWHRLGAPTGLAASRTPWAATQLEEADPCAGFPHLTFDRVAHNNLGGKGPDDGAEGLIYLGHGTVGGQVVPVRVEVHARSEYPSHPVQTADANGLNGEYAQVFLRPGWSVNLTLEIFDPSTGDALRLPDDFTFFDLDTGVGGETAEFITVSGFDNYTLSEDTEVEVAADGDGRTTFTGTTEGHHNDNPRDPLRLSAQQRNRAVTLAFKNMSQMNFTVGSTSGALSRGFSFVGRPSLLCARTVAGTATGEPNSTNSSTGVVTATPAPPHTPRCCFDLIFTRFLCKDAELTEWWEFWRFRCG